MHLRTPSCCNRREPFAKAALDSLEVGKFSIRLIFHIFEQSFKLFKFIGSQAGFIHEHDIVIKAHEIDISVLFAPSVESRPVVLPVPSGEVIATPSSSMTYSKVPPKTALFLFS